ncbi:adenylate kinase family protein [Thermoproteota archaeon]
MVVNGVNKSVVSFRKTRRINTSPIIIGITGTPGTGKKSIGKILANYLNYKFLNLNQIASKSDAIVSVTENDLEIDPDKLRNQVEKQIVEGNIVLVGHLLPHVISKDKIKFVVVLRCSPEELKIRYSARGYSVSKINDNIMSEILDICFVDALNAFGADSIVEFDTTGQQPIEIAQEIAKICRGNPKKTINKINWMSKISDEDDIKKYLV